jgi:ABC-type uncharacterized transport system ATPase subunit
VLLVSEDLDELLELADRIVVMFNGRFVYETAANAAELTEIGRHTAGHLGQVGMPPRRAIDLIAS